jgi:methionyl aminopeptidase
MAAILKSRAEILAMKKSGRVAQKILQALGQEVCEGQTPRGLDKIARQLFKEHGAKSCFLGHHGYPAVITVSPNEAVVHGIPSDEPFVSGDVISLDVGASVNGWIGDNAWTYPVGEISPGAERLLRVTRESLFVGIKKAKPGAHVGDVGQAIQDYVESHGYSVVRPLVGHGVGRKMWEEPQVPNYGPAGQGPKLRAGMTIAIEPMVNEGGEDVRQLDDGWTYVTSDGSLSAHFEHTVAILSDGAEILTSLD